MSFTKFLNRSFSKQFKHVVRDKKYIHIIVIIIKKKRIYIYTKTFSKYLKL